MVEQKKKLRLDELQVDSFVTSAATEVKGGTSAICSGWFCEMTWEIVVTGTMDPQPVNQSAVWECASQKFAHCDTKMDEVIVYG